MPNLHFPIPDHRFDQKNEMFKRAVWDEKYQPLSHRVSGEAVFKDKVGHRKIDYAHTTSRRASSMIS